MILRYKDHKKAVKVIEQVKVVFPYMDDDTPMLDVTTHDEKRYFVPLAIVTSIREER